MKKTLLIAIPVLASLGIISYLQFASAVDTEVSLYNIELIQDEKYQSKFKLVMQLENKSILNLSAGYSKLVVTSNDEVIGEGILDPVNLNAVKTTLVNGTFYVDKYNIVQKSDDLSISGVIKFDLGMVEFDYPFDYPVSSSQKKVIYDSTQPH